jgi:decaprenyl-diphosphate synthase subunit 2
MSQAIGDMAEAEFIGERDKQNMPLPSPGLTEEDWTMRNVLSAGSLLGKSCEGTLKLAGHRDELQKSGYRFGQHLALAWQVGFLEVLNFPLLNILLIGMPRD